jgi:hypothetical protein
MRLEIAGPGLVEILETDDNEKRFDEKLGKIAKQKPGALPLKKGGTKTAK